MGLHESSWKMVVLFAILFMARLSSAIPSPMDDVPIANAHQEAGAAAPSGAAGPSGEVGPSGTAGPSGAAGPSSGAAGPSGKAGPSGTAGPSGAAGPSGEAGPSGAAGPSGEAGPSGTAGPSGAAGPSGEAGPSGTAGSRPKPNRIPKAVIESRLRTAILAYQENGNPMARDYIDWVLHNEQRALMPKSLVRLAEKYYVRLDDFWPTVEEYVTYRYNHAKNDPTQKKSFFKRFFPSKQKPIHMSLESAIKFERIERLIDQVMINPEKPLTANLLKFRGPGQLDENVRATFERTLITALKTDAKLGLNGVGVKEISHAFVLNGLNNEAEHQFNQQFIQKTIKGVLEPRIFRFIREEYVTDWFGAIKSQNQPKTFDFLESRAKFKEYEPPSRPFRFACQDYLRPARRRRRGASACLLEEEEYRKVVKKVEKEGVVKEVVDTEKFLEMLDHFERENQVTQRKQLLELGAALSEDPGVTFEGDYVSQLKDIIKPLDESVQSEINPQLPENPLGEGPLPSESSMDHPGGIYSSDPVQGISANPQDTFHDPINVHDPTNMHDPTEIYDPINIHEEPVIHPEETGGFHTPVDIEPIVHPDNIHSIDVAPIKIPTVIPEVRVPTPTFEIPISGRG